MSFAVDPLRNPLALIEGETPASFISRLAAQHLAASAAEFCSDFLMDFDKIARGNPDQLAKLAWFTSCDLDSLRRHAPQIHNQNLLLGRARFPKHLTTAGRLRVCPECLALDIAAAPELRRDVAAAQRALWLIGPVRSCMLHERALVEVAPRGKRRHDFAMRIDDCLDDLDAWFDRSPVRVASPFERYIVQRIQTDDCGLELLDPLSIGETCSVCLWFGTFALKGPAGKIVGASEEELNDAAIAGFEILKLGPEGLGDFVSDTAATALRMRNARTTPHHVLGLLYLNLREDRDSTPQYATIRTIVAKSLSKHIPPNADQTPFLGIDVGNSAPVTLHSLRKSTGLAINTLKRLLSAIAKDKPDQAVQEWRWRAVPQSEATALFGTLRSLIDSTELGIRFGLARHTLVDLADAGTLVPIEGKFTPKLLAYYRSDDVSKFEARLLSKLKSAPTSEKLVSLGHAAGATSVHPADLIALILEGVIDGFTSDASVTSADQNIRVRVEQIRSHLGGTETGVTTREAARTLGTNEKVVGALVQEKLIEGRNIRCVQSGRWRTSISTTSLEAFGEAFITHTQVGRHLKLNPAQTSQLLERSGINVEIDPGKVFCRIYRRSAVRSLLHANPHSP
ncbi:TniQ family protein [Bosea vaviloviae]|uniref:TniQ domain-containing protein n=1 Tax=Bosea vaviloviae TaxID=1526658 RepID=A0A1D7U4B0_9HYPH|nr:TniQ family protein [Bosea vaviloviae]AOO82216.1 hypothetical protein BHK69_18795 [Bosea vaviloviae]